MKRLLNEAGTFREEMISGFVAAYGRYLRRVPGAAGVVANGAPVPGHVSVVIGGGSIWMSAGFSEEEEEAAWYFLKHLVSPESTAYWHINTGYFPVDRRALELDEVKELHAQYPQFRVAIDQLEASTPSLATQGALIGVFPEARAAIEEAMEMVLLGFATPKEALDEAAREVTNAIRRYNIQMGL